MAKYIKLEDAIDDECPLMEIWNDCIGCPLNDSAIEPCKIGKWIESLPTIEVVRCKDCKHYDKRTTHTGLCGWLKASGYILGVGFNDYCSMANQDPITESEE